MTFEEFSKMVWLILGVGELISIIMIVCDHSRRIKRLEEAVFAKLGELLYGK